jgi:hypothetical protein
MKKFTQIMKNWYFLSLFPLFFICSSFYIIYSDEEQAEFIEKKLTALYDNQRAEKIIKRYELSVTKSGFCRYKVHYQNGKIEYFSFNFLKYKDIDFLGSSVRGFLYLRTMDDDVIVQTYHDRDGDIDSMANFMIIPLRLVEPQDLNILGEQFRSMSAVLKKQQTLQFPHGGKPQ